MATNDHTPRIIPTLPRSKPTHICSSIRLKTVRTTRELESVYIVDVARQWYEIVPRHQADRRVSSGTARLVTETSSAELGFTWDERLGDHTYAVVRGSGVEPPEPPPPATEKACAECHTVQPIGNFQSVSTQRSVDGRSFVCDNCRNGARRRIAELNGHTRRIHELYAEGSHTEAEWAALLIACGNRCLRCDVRGDETPDRKLTRDHVRPISKGGTDFISNIQPLCRSCNSWKRDREIDFRTPKDPK